MHQWKVGDIAVCNRVVDGFMIGTSYKVIGVRTFSRREATDICEKSSTELLLPIYGPAGEVFRDACNFEPTESAPERLKRPEASRPHPFWLVKGRGPTASEHHSELSADDEAKRLAKQMPGVAFTVLGPIRAHRTGVAEVTDFSASLGLGSEFIPF